MKYPPVDQLVPHEAPMRLIDEVQSFDAARNCIVCRAVPGDDCPFADNGRIPAIVAMEYMAQSVAAHVTLLRALQASSQRITPRVGYIISARNLKLHVEELRAGEALTISATLVWRDSATANFDCELHLGKRLAASTQLSVYEPPSARATA